MKRFGLEKPLWILAIFLAGFSSHLLYQRWTSPMHSVQVYPVTFVPSTPPLPPQREVPVLQARDVEQIKAQAGNRARVRGRVYRVGHSAKSNTYFLNFGPARSAFTGVIFASSVELFEQKNLHPKGLEGKEVEVLGEIKDHPNYGLEMVLEDPSQVKVLD